MEKCFIQMRAYNDEKTIKRAIDSVLMQDYPNVELIVLDDGSTDHTGDIVKGYDNPNVHYVRQQNKGPAGLSGRLLRKRFAAPMKTITFFLWTVTIFIPEGTPFPEP